MEINNAGSSDCGNNSNSGNILKELSDIKTSIALNTLETSTTKDSVNEVKAVVKEMQKNYITQDQHKVLSDISVDHETRIRTNETNITKIMTWGSIVLVALSLVDVFIRKWF